MLQQDVPFGASSPAATTLRTDRKQSELVRYGTMRQRECELQ